MYHFYGLPSEYKIYIIKLLNTDHTNWKS